MCDNYFDVGDGDRASHVYVTGTKYAIAKDDSPGLHLGTVGDVVDVDNGSRGEEDDTCIALLFDEGRRGSFTATEMSSLLLPAYLCEECDEWWREDDAIETGAATERCCPACTLYAYRSIVD